MMVAVTVSPYAPARRNGAGGHGGRDGVRVRPRRLTGRQVHAPVPDPRPAGAVAPHVGVEHGGHGAEVEVVGQRVAGRSGALHAALRVTVAQARAQPHFVADPFGRREGGRTGDADVLRDVHLRTDVRAEVHRDGVDAALRRGRVRDVDARARGEQ